MVRLITILLICALWVGCKKSEPLCQRMDGNLILRNTSENQQRVDVDALILIMVDGLSTVTIYDLSAGDYEIRTVDQVTGATATIFVRVDNCEDSEIII